MVERRLPDDWESRYAPVLLETFCETPRFSGTCYRAASKVGATQGRSKLDTRRERALPVKDAEAPAAGLEADPQKIDRHLTSERLRLLRPRSPIEDFVVLANRASPLVSVLVANHRPAQRSDLLTQPKLEIGERLGTLPLGPRLEEGSPNALAVAAPFSTMDAKDRTASAAAGESLERDKPFEDCETDMGMLLMLWGQANILPHLAVRSMSVHDN